MNKGSVKVSIATASQGKLIWWRFKRFKPGVVSLVIVVLLYSGALFAPFLSPIPYDQRTDYLHAPVQTFHWRDNQGNFSLRPFVYDLKLVKGETVFENKWVIDREKKLPVYFFVKGSPYKLFGFLHLDIHLFGVKEGPIFIMGGERLGRDLFGRVLQGSQISLSIGLVSIAFSLILGIVLGGAAGFIGGAVDMLIMRVIEVIQAIPTLPLWMALSAAIPKEWSALNTYFFMTVILSLVGWTGVARAARNKLMAVREEDYVMAAKLANASGARIAFVHLLPSFYTQLILNATGAIPGMIMGETSLSFIGLGLQVPLVSWGTLLRDAQTVQALALYPWLLFPALFLFITVMAFNLVGDGIRDAADPYSG